MEQEKNCGNCLHYKDGLEFCDTCTCLSKPWVNISAPTNWVSWVKDKPTICMILGVDVEEQFTIGICVEIGAAFWEAPIRVVPIYQAAAKYRTGKGFKKCRMT